MMTYRADGSEVEPMIGSMRAIQALGSTSHLLTFAAVAICESRGDDVINPRHVHDVRQELTGINRASTSVRKSMRRLVEAGLVEMRDREPHSNRARYDWRLSDEGWRLLRVSGLITVIESFARAARDDEDYQRHRELIQQTMQDINDLEITKHLIALIAVAVLDQQDVSPINGPVVIRFRREILQDDSWTPDVYVSLDMLEDVGLIEKRDLEPDKDRTRLDVRVTEEGWRLLCVSGLIRMVHNLAALF